VAVDQKNAQILLRRFGRNGHTHASRAAVSLVVIVRQTTGTSAGGETLPFRTVYQITIEVIFIIGSSQIRIVLSTADRT